MLRISLLEISPPHSSCRNPLSSTTQHLYSGSKPNISARILCHEDADCRTHKDADEPCAYARQAGRAAPLQRLNADVVGSGAVNQLVETVPEVEKQALPATVLRTWAAGRHDPYTAPVIAASSVNFVLDRQASRQTTATAAASCSQWGVQTPCIADAVACSDDDSHISCCWCCWWCRRRATTTTKPMERGRLRRRRMQLTANRDDLRTASCYCIVGRSVGGCRWLREDEDVAAV